MTKDYRTPWLVALSIGVIALTVLVTVMVVRPPAKTNGVPLSTMDEITSRVHVGDSQSTVVKALGKPWQDNPTSLSNWPCREYVYKASDGRVAIYIGLTNSPTDARKSLNDSTRGSMYNGVLRVEQY